MTIDFLNPYFWLLKCDQTFKQFSESSLYQAQAPVISVGNINTGGSGKTPFIVYLSLLLSKKFGKKNILIVSKSYKAQTKRPVSVDPEHAYGASLYGDEPFLIKSILKDVVDVWAGPTKWKTIQAAEKIKKYDVILVDDGFSHHALKKNLDIVLFDVSRNKQHYQLLPFGRLREPLSSLQRSGLVVLTKKEGVDPHQIDDYRRLIKSYQNQCIDSQYVTDISAVDLQKKYYFFCGLGNPENVMNELKRLGVQLVHTEILKDHYSYSEQWQKEMVQSVDPDVYFLTTRKDFIKLSDRPMIKKTYVIDSAVVLDAYAERVLCEKISTLF